MFCPEFACLLAAFEDPGLGHDAKHRDVVQNYLDSQTIPPTVIEQIAEQDPDRASALFAAALGRPSFDWTKQGAALLRKHKPGYFEQPRLPSNLPLPHRMVEGLLALDAAKEKAAQLAG